MPEIIQNSTGFLSRVIVSTKKALLPTSEMSPQ